MDEDEMCRAEIKRRAETMGLKVGESITLPDCILKRAMATTPDVFEQKSWCNKFEDLYKRRQTILKTLDKMTNYNDRNICVKITAHGRGLFAKQDLRGLELTFGECMQYNRTKKVPASMTAVYDYCMQKDDSDNRYIACPLYPRVNIAALCNHNDANPVLEKPEAESMIPPNAVTLKTKALIMAGTEITFDYGGLLSFTTYTATQTRDGVVVHTFLPTDAKTNQGQRAYHHKAKECVYWDSAWHLIENDAIGKKLFEPDPHCVYVGKSSVYIGQVVEAFNPSTRKAAT